MNAQSPASRPTLFMNRALPSFRMDLQGHADWVMAVAFSPDSRILATASRDGTVNLWDVESGQLQDVLEGHSGGALAAAFLPDGSMLAAAGNSGVICLWDVRARRLWGTVQAGNAPVRSLAFSQGGGMLAAASSGVYRAGEIYLWDWQARKLLSSFAGPHGGVWCVSFSPLGERLASAHLDGNVRIWELDGHVRRVPLDRQAMDVVGSLAGQQPLTGQQTLLKSPTSSDSRTRAGHGLMSWEGSPPGERLLAGHRSLVWSVAFSAGGQAVASGSLDGTVRLWDPASGDLRWIGARRRPVRTVAFSPGGEMIMAAAGGINQAHSSFEVQLWETTTGKFLGSLSGDRDAVYCIAWAPDGATLATGGADGLVKLWTVNGQ